MAYIASNLWSKRPPPGVLIDWSHPLAQSLKGLFVDYGNGVCIDIVNNNVGIQEGTFTQVSTPDGIVDYSTNTGRFRFPYINAYDHGAHPAWSWFVRGVASWSTATLYSWPFGRTANGGSSPYHNWSFEKSGAAAITSTIKTNITTRSTAGTHGLSDGVIYDLSAVAVGGVGISQYKNGGTLISGPGACDPLQSYTTGITDVYVNGRTGYYFSGGASVCGCWGRALSTDDLRSLWSNPWQIFQPVRRVVYVDMGAGGGGQSLAASLFSESTNFQTATIAVGPAPQALTASKFTESGAFYTAALSTQTPLTASLFSESTNFPAASISTGAGPQTLTASLFSESATFHAATLSQQLFLVASLFSESTTFHPATLIGGSLFVTASLFSESQVFYESTISVQILYTPDIQQIVFDALEELMAFKQNIKIEQGATFRCIISCKDTDGNVVPLTGCTARAQVRYAYTDTTPAGTFTCTVDETLGTVTCEMTAATTSALTKTSGVWDCEMVYAGGTVQRLVEGRATISPEVTK